MDYDLQRLGTREFEHLTQSIAIKVFGSAVKVFGDGPDGGREATFRGAVDYPQPGTAGKWNGYGVIQAKFRSRPTTTSQDSNWFIGQIRAELELWKDKKSQRVKKGELPDYLLFTTNVYLSSIPEAGGIDKADAVIAEYANEIGLKGWDVWSGDQLNRYLGIFANIRRNYMGFITPGDVLAQIVDLLGGNAADLNESLALHAAKDLGASRWVRLNQAGSPTNDRLTLSDIGVDLPAVHNRRQKVPRMIEHIIDHGDQVLRPSSSTGGKHLVIVAGPGQGKTTLTQLLCQTYRVALLADRPTHTLGPAGTVFASTKERLAALEIQLPKCRRWPITIGLSEFGDAVAEKPDLDLLRFVAQQFNKRAGTDVTPWQLKSWLREWPWLLVLDGLDEVAHPTVRDDVDQRIQEFLTEAASVDADLLVVATTRPQGYNDEFSPEFFDHYVLRHLTSQEAMRYGHELAHVRHHDDPDHESVIVQRVDQAASDENTAYLMRTPLQITIMTLLLEQRAGVPPTRFRLFDSYYDTIYRREIAKPGVDADLLNEHKNDIDALHEKVALLLQANAERSGDAEAALPVTELEELAVRRMQDEGAAAEQAKKLASRIVDAATRRLVLLAPVIRDHVGYDVRSLQEFMAARAITTGPDSEVAQRLELLAPANHWRNTWLLAVGRVFADREHLRQDVVGILDSIDLNSELSRLVTPGALLAVDLLEDGVARRTPRFQRQIAKRALAALNYPPSSIHGFLAEQLIPTFEDSELLGMVRLELERAVNSTDWRLASSIVLLSRWQQTSNNMTAWARTQLRAAEEKLTASIDGAAAAAIKLLTAGAEWTISADPERLFELLGQEIKAAEDNTEHAILSFEFGSRLANISQSATKDGWLVSTIRGVLQDSTSPHQDALDLARLSEKLMIRDWPVAALLRDVARQWLSQQPVAIAVADLLEGT
ncbi:NACHT domain-containing protein [Amycolatopsis sp. NPDC059021]|uniref:NACHT domain-containing protein n=1 Tax=Amycolatopsis sp. NPDC059021 TaxID=3346704 RepID=UPI00366EEFF9